MENMKNVGDYHDRYLKKDVLLQPRPQSHLFTIRERRKRGTGALQTLDQNMPK